MKKEEVILAIQGGARLDRFPDYFDDEEVILTAIANGDTNGFTLCPEELLSNREFILRAAIKHPQILGLTGAAVVLQRFFTDKNFIREVLQSNGSALLYTSVQDFQRDEELVECALRQNGLVFRLVARQFQDNERLARIAVAQNHLAIRDAPEALRDDEVLINEIVTINGTLLKEASARLQKNKPTTLFALAQNGLALEFVDDHLKNDQDVINTALTQNGLALQYLLSKEKDDATIVRKAIAQNPKALAYASLRLRSDYDFMAEMVRNHENALQHASDALRKDRDFTIIALVSHREAFPYVHETLKNDPIISRLAKAPGDASMLLALLPLKKKLREETNPTAKTVATQMIASLEDLIVSQIEKKTPVSQAKESIKDLIKKTRQPLEKLPWWQTVIDHFMAAVLSFFPGPHQKRTFLFFPNPNPLKKEMDEIQKSIDDDPTPPSAPV